MESDSSIVNLSTETNSDYDHESEFLKQKAFYKIALNKHTKSITTKNVEVNASMNYDDYILLLVGLLSSQVFGFALGFSAIVFGLCLMKHRIPEFEYTIMFFFILCLLLERFNFISLRVLPICDISFSLNTYVTKKYFGYKDTVFLTLSIVSFLYPLFYYNVVICFGKYLVNGDLYINNMVKKINIIVNKKIN